MINQGSLSPQYMWTADVNSSERPQMSISFIPWRQEKKQNKTKHTTEKELVLLEI